MTHKSTILFDLDGTLTDPGIGITNSVAYALKKFGIPVPERELLYPFIGPPLADSFRTYFGLSAQEAEQAIAWYREYFQDHGLFENAVYPGIPALLKSLKQDGRHLIVATSKPEVFARRILEHFDLIAFFDLVAGSLLDNTRTRKDEVIAWALAHTLPQARQAAVMVGDRLHDIEGARKNGLDSIGVLFGYGSREELTAAGASAIAETVDDLGRLLQI